MFYSCYVTYNALLFNLIFATGLAFYSPCSQMYRYSMRMAHRRLNHAGCNSVNKVVLTYISASVRFLHKSIWCSFIPLACAACDDSLPFSGASSVPVMYFFLPTLLHQLFFHPLSPHLAIYFLVYLSILLFPNSYIPFWEKMYNIKIKYVYCLTVISDLLT